MRIILADINRDLVEAWAREFAGFDGVEVVHGSIFDVVADALVSPANSFGHMAGGLDGLIVDHFGFAIQERVHEALADRHGGELPVGEAEIVETDDPDIPYLISAPTMRTPGQISDPRNVYLATCAVIQLVQHGVLEDGTDVADAVETVAIPGMGTGVGRVSPEECARQMRSAIEDTLE